MKKNNQKNLFTQFFVIFVYNTQVQINILKNKIQRRQMHQVFFFPTT